MTFMHDWKVERMNLMMPVNFLCPHKVVKSQKGRLRGRLESSTVVAVNEMRCGNLD